MLKDNWKHKKSKRFWDGVLHNIVNNVIIIIWIKVRLKLIEIIS